MIFGICRKFSAKCSLDNRLLKNFDEQSNCRPFGEVSHEDQKSRTIDLSPLPFLQIGGTAGRSVSVVPRPGKKPLEILFPRPIAFCLPVGKLGTNYPGNSHFCRPSLRQPLPSPKVLSNFTDRRDPANENTVQIENLTILYPSRTEDQKCHSDLERHFLRFVRTRQHCILRSKSRQSSRGALRKHQQ